MNRIDEMKLYDVMKHLNEHNLDDGILMSDAIDNVKDFIKELKNKYNPSIVDSYLLKEYGWK